MFFEGSRQGEFPLLRVRNPWGNDKEWKGTWSDGSAVWNFVPDGEKTNIGLNFDHDGEFYMSQMDFFNNFDVVEMCNLSPDIHGVTDWNVEHLEGSWTKGVNAGGSRNTLETFATNPQFVMTLTDSDEDSDELCTCVVSLLQKMTRRNRVVKHESHIIGESQRDIRRYGGGGGLLK